MKTVILDTGPLGRVAHPRCHPEVTAWFFRLLTAEWQVIVPEIADYEVRREFLLQGMRRSVERLDEVLQDATYVPISTSAMRKAAELWAEARRQGLPTSDPSALDGDMILAAQALEVGGIVATDNVRHLIRFVDARDWRKIAPESEE